MESPPPAMPLKRWLYAEISRLRLVSSTIVKTAPAIVNLHVVHTAVIGSRVVSKVLIVPALPRVLIALQTCFRLAIARFGFKITRIGLCVARVRQGHSPVPNLPGRIVEMLFAAPAFKATFPSHSSGTVVIVVHHCFFHRPLERPTHAHPRAHSHPGHSSPKTTHPAAITAPVSKSVQY